MQKVLCILDFQRESMLFQPLIPVKNFTTSYCHLLPDIDSAYKTHTQFIITVAVHDYLH